MVSRERAGLGQRSAAALIRKAVGMAIEDEKITVPCLVSVMLTDDEGIRRINREFRGVDSATDVLSFPLNELQPGALRFAEKLVDIRVTPQHPTLAFANGVLYDTAKDSLLLPIWPESSLVLKGLSPGITSR